MNEWSNEAGCLELLVLVAGVHWLLYNIRVVIPRISSAHCMDLLSRDPNTEQRDGEAGSLLICEGVSRWSLTDMVSLTRLGLPEVEQDMEWWKIHFTRSEAFWVLIPLSWWLDVWFHVLHILLWTWIFKYGKCLLEMWDWFSGFLTLHCQGSIYGIFLLYPHVVKMSGWVIRKTIKKLLDNQSSITTSKVHWQHDVTDDKH